MLPVVMEESMTDTSQWDGVLGMVSGSHLYYKLTSDVDAEFDDAVGRIAAAIRCKTVPHCQAKQMKEQGTGGRILFMSSVTGLQSHPHLVPYGMTKAALIMLAKGLVGELSQYGITVNAISPGAVRTERTIGDDPEFEASWSGATPNGRVASPEDIADAALFLASDKAKHVTGQNLVVDGGWTSTSPVPNLVIPN